MRAAASGASGLPVEQSEAWERFEISQGRGCWGRFAWFEGSKRVAVIALYEYRVRNWRYLWAKWGPVWIKEATPEREAALRADLAAHARATDPGLTFIRLHATYSAPDLRPLLQTMTFDRTIVVDTSSGTEEGILDSMPTDGKRSIRRALKRADEESLTLTEDTGVDEAGFAEHYAVLVETAERDGFRPHPASTYLSMLDTLGPEHARLFSMRDAQGRVLCWDIVLVNDRRAQAEYGASTDAARRLGAPPLLDYRVAAILGAEGVRGFDLMGIHSPRVPELFGVGKYKSAFAARYTDVPGGWDMPLKERTYAMLVSLLRLKYRAR
ncbi:GNAT family N-acetyltransferase [Actinomyces sp. B33]|nr:GNAT family N-acetyltransferase [Actinomyces sp. B33]MDC4233204.1 GNAT family N-acetyltransferase [Actinomyces sp. B33]